MPGTTEIFVCATPADMRRSFYGLCGMVRHVLEMDPLEGALFVFFNRRKDMVKVLWYEDGGFAIWMKRLDKGAFTITLQETQGRQTSTSIAPTSAPLSPADITIPLSVPELAQLLKKVQ